MGYHEYQRVWRWTFRKDNGFSCKKARRPGSGTESGQQLLKTVDALEWYPHKRPTTTLQDSHTGRYRPARQRAWKALEMKNVCHLQPDEGLVVDHLFGRHELSG
jgi:hypothetical protein